MTDSSLASVSAADFGTRFSAFVVDAFVLFVGQWLLFIVLARQLQAVGMTTTEPCNAETDVLCEGPSTALWVVLVALFVVTTLGYHAFFEGRHGATPGKRLLGLQVTDRNGHSPIGLTASLLRSIVRQAFWLLPLFVFEASPLSLGLPAIVFVVLPLAALSVFVVGAIRSDGLGVHDLVANTVVVRLDGRSLPPAPQKVQLASSSPQRKTDIIVPEEDS